MSTETASLVPPAASGRTWRLSILLALIALVTTRLSLVIHEFIAHGGMTLALGSTVDDFRLFLFGGGWVSFHREPPYSIGETLAISVAGIALELAVGIVLIAIAPRLRPASWLRALVIAFGAIDIIHALYYLAAGTHHGYGDGRVLHVLLGGWRPLTVGAISTLAIALSVLLSRWFATELVPWLSGRSARRRLAQLGIAAVFAGAVHGALMLTEQVVTDDPTYADVMQHHSQRQVDRELAQRVRTGSLSADELAALRVALERQYRRFPVKQVLLIAIGLGLALGATVGVRVRRAAVPLGWRPVMALAIVCAGALALVLVLRQPWWR